MPAILQNPFMNAADVVMPAAEQAVVSQQPRDAAADPFPRGFDPVKFMEAIEDRCWRCGSQGMSCYCTRIGCPFDDPPPVFLSDPSDDFISAMHRDVLPLIEDYVRRA